MDISKWLYTLFFVLFGESLCRDGVELSKHDNRIAGGRKTDIRFHPYQVFLNVLCGGVIIGRRWILTAAHCNHKILTTVYVGSSEIIKGKQYKIKSVIESPLFFEHKNVLHFDFMLLKLNKALVYEPTVRPIEISRDQSIPSGIYGNVTGWGHTQFNGTMNRILRVTTLPIFDRYACKRYFNQTILRGSEFCAGFVKGGKDSCQGDSGGPFVVNGKLIGLVSYGFGCAQPGRAGVYGFVPYVLPWIRRITGIK